MTREHIEFVLSEYSIDALGGKLLELFDEEAASYQHTINELNKALSENKGEWIYNGDCYICNQCKSAFNWWADSQTSNYCPNCGARMKGGERMKIHELKISPKYFEAVNANKKRFELRKDDRDFKVGDLITLREYDNGQYTGRQISNMPICYILRDVTEYGLREGYCILGF